MCDIRFGAERPAGSSSGVTTLEEPCTVYYLTSFDCEGDPSIPGSEGPLIKFEPIEEQACEPDVSGSGSVSFYSNWPPTPIDPVDILVLIKFSRESCGGTITGVLPECTCGPTPTETNTWGKVKTVVR